jgi:protein-S-isoprenylcysteine O-methyltransferase Ste14
VQPLTYRFPYVLLFWVICVWAYWPEMMLIARSRRAPASARSIDAGSLRAIMIGFGMAFAAASWVAWVPAWRWSPDSALLAFVGGLSLLIVGSVLRRHCRRELGRYFTANVAAQPEQPVIATGAYAWVRHPSYSGGVLMNTGFGITLGSWGSALILFFVSVALYSYRIQVEERALLATIGEPYRAFMAPRKRLIPFLY